MFQNTWHHDLHSFINIRLGTVKSHRANVLSKERELQELAENLAQREATISAVVSQKDAEINRLNGLLAQTDVRVRQAVSAREEELRILVMRREAEVRAAMTRREEEILGKDKAHLVFPESILSPTKALDVLRILGTERAALHKSRLVWCFVGMPISAPFALVPM